MGDHAILVVATLDTKGTEAAYLAERIAARGAKPVIVDVGILGDSTGITPSVTRHRVARAGGRTLGEIIALGARGPAVAEMMRGLAALVPSLHATHNFSGGCGIGGAEGALLAASGLRTLPFGIPKVILSPILSGARQFGPFVGEDDVTLVHSVVDLQGLNSYTRPMLDLVASFVCVGPSGSSAEASRPRVGMSLNGNTTPVGALIRDAVAQRGYEVISFHSNGVGGVAMERLAARGGLDFVIDLTTNELVEEVVDGLWAVTDRLRIAAQVPRVVVAGCLDFICQPRPDRIDSRFRGRPLDVHNPEITLVRVSSDEAVRIAEQLVERLLASRAAVQLIVPTKGLSLPGSPGGSFHDPAADAVFVHTLKEASAGRFHVEYVDAPINDERVASAVVEAFDSIAESRTRATVP